MFIDLEILIDSRKIEYDYKIDHKRVFISFKIPDGHKKLTIRYDDNIYDDFKLNNNQSDKFEPGFISFNLEKIKLQELSFSLKVNYKYYVKLVYNHYNFKYSKDELINKLDLLYQVNHEDEVLSIIKILKEENLNDKFMYYEIDKLIIDILTNNQYYDSLINQMNDYDLLNIITYYISVPCPYQIDQEEFDVLVEEAKIHNYPSENIWRLAMNYDQRDYDFSKVEEYFVNSKDLYYLSEYIYGVSNANLENIVNLIIKTKDKEYINKVINDDNMKKHLGDLIKKLEE